MINNFWEVVWDVECVVLWYWVSLLVIYYNIKVNLSAHGVNFNALAHKIIFATKFYFVGVRKPIGYGHFIKDFSFRWKFFYLNKSIDFHTDSVAVRLLYIWCIQISNDRSVNSKVSLVLMSHFNSNLNSTI